MMRLLLSTPAGVVLWVPLRAADDYKHGPDSHGTAGRAQGQDHQAQLDRARSFPAPSAITGSTSRPSTMPRRPPASWSSRTAAAISIPNGDFRVPIVFDNLIHKKEMPVTIGIFINPGTVPPPDKEEEGAQQPQLRVRHAVGSVRPLPGEGNPARGGARRTTCARTRRAGPSAASARAASAPSPPPGNGPTCSARCSATSAASPTSAAATSIPA